MARIVFAFSHSLYEGGIKSNATNDFVCFVALRSKSTAMVMAGRSVHLTTVFLGQALIRLRGCAGWSAPVLFAALRRQDFSR